MIETYRAKLLRVYIDEGEHFEHRLLYAEIVDALRKAGFGGATVRCGIEGYGIHKIVRTARSIEGQQSLPILIETIDEEAKIVAFLPQLRSMVREGLVTLQNVTLVRYVEAGSG